MAVDLLQCKTVVPGVCHDLQSFYWVLMWLVLRHTNHSLGPDYCFKLFKNSSDLAAAGAKTWWISPFSWSTGERLTEFAVTNNAPLTALIEDFRDLNDRACFYPRASPPIPLNHDSVLVIFCKAVADPIRWPENDFVRCTLTLPENIVEDSVVSAQCEEIATESEEDDGVVDVDVPRHKDDERADTDVAGQPNEEADSLSAPGAEPAAAASVCEAKPQQQGMTTRLRAKRKANAAAPSSSRGGGPPKRQKTNRSLRATGARHSTSRGKKVPGTRLRSI